MFTPQNPDTLFPLFQNDARIPVRAYFEGGMGRGWADHPTRPRCARIINGDLAFFGGDAAAPGAAGLVHHLPDDHPSGDLILVADSPAWKHHMDCLPIGLWVRRYAMAPRAFDTARLVQLSRPPQGYEILPIDEGLYHQARALPFARDFVSQFPSYSGFAARGLGFCAVRDGRIAGGASSYLSLPGAIEIQVEVHPDHQRRGLAAACAAALILKCLGQNIHPGWDAANPASVSLAQKLGYAYLYTYPALHVDMNALRGQK